MIDFNEISAISKTWNYRKTEDRNGTEDSFAVPEYSEKLKLKKIGGKSVVWNQICKNEHFSAYDNRKVNLTKNGDVYTAEILHLTSFTYEMMCFVPSAYRTSTILGHVYLYHHKFKCDKNCTIVKGMSTISTIAYTNVNNWESIDTIHTSGSVDQNSRCYVGFASFDNITEGDKYEFKDYCLIDLTKLFGAGNEPTTTTDPRITAIKKYLETHPEYNEGEIIDSLVDEIEVDGVNLFDESLLSDINNYTERSFYNGSYVAIKINIPNGDYKFTTKHKSNYVSGMSNTVFFVTPVNTTESTTTGLNFEHVTSLSRNVDVSYTLTVDNEELFISVYRNQFDSDVIKNWLKCIDIQISKSSTQYPYKPYTASKIITTNFPSLKSAGSVYDYIDFNFAVKLDDGNYSVNVVRNVGSVDLGTLTWTSETSSATGQFRVAANHLISGGVIPKYNRNLLNIYFDTVAPKAYSQFNDGELGWSNASSSIVLRARKIYLTDLSAQEFKQAMEGQILYYELATPTTETITISAELLEWLKVEYGGNMYYKQDGLSLPIPNTTSIHKHIEKTEELAQIVIDDEVVWSAPVSMFNLYDDIIIDDDETSVNEDEVIDNGE